MNDLLALRSFLRRVRHRLRAAQVANGGVVVLITVGSLILLLLLTAAYVGPSPLWRWSKLLLALSAAAAAAWIARHAILRWHSDETVARLVDAKAGLGDLMLSAVELARTLPQIAHSSAISTTLIEAEIALAAERSRQWQPQTLVRIWPSRQRLLLLTLIVTAAVAASLSNTARISQGWKTLATSPATPRRYVDPIIGDVELTLNYPAYTGLPPRHITGSSGDVLAPIGTTIEVSARPLLAATISAEFLLTSDEAEGKWSPLPVRLYHNRLSASFVIKAAGSYYFALHSSAKRIIREPAPHRIEVDPDRAPRVDLRAPAAELEVHGARDKVELAYAIDDDYGIKDVVLVWNAAEHAEQNHEQRAVVTQGVGKRELSGTWLWDLIELDFPPGTRIAYHLEATDNNDASGPNVGISRTFYLRIFSPAEKHEALLRAMELLVKQAADALAARIGSDLKESKNPQTTANHLAEQFSERGVLQEKERSFISALMSVLSNMSKDPLAARDLQPTLSGIRQRLDQLRKNEDDLLNKVRGNPSSASALHGSDQRFVGEFERDTLLIDDLAARGRLEQVLSVADGMTRARDRLRQLLEAYRKSRSPAMRQQIERELKDLERQLAELERKAANLAGEVPDEFINQQALGDNDLHKRLDNLKTQLNRGEIDHALSELERLSQSVDRMVASLEGNLRGFKAQRFSQDERALGDLASQVKDLERDEREIAKQIEGLHGGLQQEQERVLKERIQTLMGQIRGQAAEIKKRLAMDEAALGMAAQSSLEHAHKSLQDFAQTIDHGDLDDLGKAAHDLENSLYALQLSLHNEEIRQWMGVRQQVHKARAQVIEAEAIARKMGEAIAAAIPRAAAFLSEEDKAKLGVLEKRQIAVRLRTDEAQKNAAKRRSSSRNPGMLQFADEALKQASESMQQAGRNMNQGEPQRAAGQAWQAVEQLGQLRQQLNDNGRSQPSEQGGAREREEVVKIPGAGDSSVPRAFRQDLLEAMKRAVPESYREQVKRFYQELAQ